MVIAARPGARQLAPRKTNQFIEPHSDYGREFGVRPLNPSPSGGSAPYAKQAEPPIRSIEPQAEPPADLSKRFPYNDGCDTR